MSLAELRVKQRSSSHTHRATQVAVEVAERRAARSKEMSGQSSASIALRGWQTADSHGLNNEWTSQQSVGSSRARSIDATTE